MSGGGRGMCVLKMPDEVTGPVTGLAGQVGWPFSQSLETDTKLEQLHRQVRHVEKRIRAIQACVEGMEVWRRRQSITGQRWPCAPSVLREY
jgi:hypothetical protein